MFLCLAFAVALSAIAALTDLKSGRIPNWLTQSGILLGLMGHMGFGFHAGGWQMGLHEGVTSLAGLVLCGVGPAVLYSKGGMGGGDLKLYAAIGALCQPLLGLECEMYSLVVAGIAAPAWLAYRGQLLPAFCGAARVLLNPILPARLRKPLPPEAMTWFRLGPAIFAGTLAATLLHRELWPCLRKAFFQ